MIQSKYLTELHVYIDESMLKWLNEKVAQIKSSQGLWSRYNRSEFVREIIKDKMRQNP